MRLKNNIILMVFALTTALTFFFLRFYHIQNRIIFDFDQESFSRTIYEIVHDHHFSLLGPRVLSDKGFFLGPYFIYALIPFYLISQLHPIGLIYFLIVYSVIFFIASSRIISRQWSKLHAAFFLMAWATNSLIVRYDTTPWNPISIPLGVLLVWYILERIYNQNKLRDWALLGLILGLFFNQHFQFGYLIFFSIILLGFAATKKKILSIKNIAAGAGAFIATYIPLILFDLRHQFLNLKLFLSFFTEDIGGNIEHGRLLWIETYSTILQPIIGYRDPILTITFLIVFVLILIYLIREKEGFLKLFYQSTLVLWIILPFLFALYNKRLTDYYLISLYPFIYISLIDALITAKREILLPIAMIIVIYINYSLLLKVVKNNPLGLSAKDRAIRTMIAEVKPNIPVNISFNMPPGIATGYNYLLQWYHITPVDQPGVPLIEFDNPQRDGDIPVDTDIGIKIPQEVRK